MRMPDYRELYRILFGETTKAISILQAAQRHTEELYIEDETFCNLVVMDTNASSNRNPKDKYPSQD